jgi:hypothetical protein
MIGIIEKNVAPIITKIIDTAMKADAFLLTFFDNLYTTGSAKAAKTTATKRSKSNDLTLRKIRTETDIIKTYRKALFKSSCLVSPLGKFTVI